MEGSEKKTKKITVRVSEEQLKQIDLLATLWGVNRSVLVKAVLFGDNVGKDRGIVREQYQKIKEASLIEGLMDL